MSTRKFACDDRVQFSTADGVYMTGTVVHVSKRYYFVEILADENRRVYSIHERWVAKLGPAN